MWLKIAVPGIIAIILALVFFDVAVLGSRFTGLRPFGNKETTEIKKSPEPVIAASANPAASVSSPAPSAAASSSPTPKPSPKPSLKGVTGSITVLQNNTPSSAASASPAGTGTISGSIDLSGTIPSNTSIVIAAKKTGTSNYQIVLSGINASDNATWSWNGASSGTAYDLVAILKGSSNGVDTDYAKSQNYVVTAPASNQIFVVNAGSSMSAPTGSITTTCTTHNSNNTWQATINYANVSGAQAYWLQAGTTSGETDFVNVKQNSTGDPQTVSVTLTDSVVYYAQYAVASVVNPETAQYSTFSSVQSIKCP